MKHFSLPKLFLVLATVVTALFVSRSSVSAACEYMAICDATPGCCTSTCNGGQACVIGNTVIVGEVDPASCLCYRNGLAEGFCTTPSQGSACTTTEGYSGVCGCVVRDVPSCTNVTKPSCCTPGSFCGSGGGCSWLPWGPCEGACGSQTQTRENTCGGSPGIQSCTTPSCIPSGGGGGTCTPYCSPACGQGDGCGGTCGSTDAGTPGIPVIVSPTSGSTVTPNASNQVTVSWTASSKADLYQVQVYPTGTAVGSECTVTDSHCTSTSSTSYTFTLTGSTNNFTWRVRAINNSCSATDISAWTAATNFTISAAITGNIYFDDGTATYNSGTGLCTGGGSTGQNPGSGSTITAQWGGGNNTSGSITGSSFTISGLGYDPNTLVTLSPDVSQWSCSCPSGCSYSGLSAPKAGVNFYITNLKPSWWQTINGLVYAANTAGSAIKSAIPNTCNGTSCTPALLRNDDYDNANSSGFVVTGGGDIDTTYDTNTTLSYLREGGTTERIGGAQFSGIREDYTYFSQLYSIGQNPTSDFTGAKPSAQPANPPSAPVADRAYYANGNVTINNPWTVNSGEKIVVFINGNLDVNAPISVASGGFLAFIAKGNITFDSSLGAASPSSTAAVVAGVFIADGQITFEGSASGTPKFVGEGSFIGWSGVNFGRSFASVSDNNLYPTELLRFRPDFIVNVPDKMTRPLYLWQETN